MNFALLLPCATFFGKEIVDFVSGQLSVVRANNTLLGNGERTTDNGLRTTDYGLRTTDYGLRTKQLT